MDIDEFELNEDDRKFLEQYSEECCGSYFSTSIKAILLIEQKYSEACIEKMLSTKINPINRFVKIYKKYGLLKLLEQDKINSYKIYFLVKKQGWIDLCFEFGTATIIINLSNIFDPIPDLMRLLYEIDNNKELIKLEINEEGDYKVIQLNKSHMFKKSIYDFTIVVNRYPYNEYEFKKIIHKDVFVHKFIEAFIELANNSKNLNWSNDYNISEYIMNNITNFNKIFEKTNGT